MTKTHSSGDSLRLFPKLRPVDVHPSHQQRGAYDVFDPSGLADGTLTVSAATLSILAKMDGCFDKPAIQVDFLRRYGRMLFTDELDRLIEQLDKALFLEGPVFRTHLRKLTEAYRQLPARPIRDPHTLGAPSERLGEYLNSIMDHPLDSESTPASSAGKESTGSDHPIVGLIAPHLDYQRGAPCYAAAYRGLAERTDARRFVILGTNHYGRSGSVVATRKDFDTPLGVVPHDADFMKRMDRRCQIDLCDCEYDHVREHSIELQVILLKHLLSDRPFTIVPYLCPDPCGPSGTAPPDGIGIDLREFATALREEIEADNIPTCLISGADLSHIGRYFHDQRSLTAETLQAIETSDRQFLDHIIHGNAEAFRCAIATENNATHICSVGSIYAQAMALDGNARPRLLHYHQAVTAEHENCVTCAALEFTRG